MSINATMLFDGKCVFCNGAVNFALEKEVKPALYFAALQSDAGQSLLGQYGLPTDNFRTFVIINNGKAYTRFEAAIQLGYLIGGRDACFCRWAGPGVVLRRHRVCDGGRNPSRAG